jgi:hypothetical protein
MQSDILNDTISISGAYPMDVSCRLVNDRYCAIDFDTLAGTIEQYYSRCYEAGGQMYLFNTQATCNEIGNTTNMYYSYTNEPLCLGADCTKDDVYIQYNNGGTRLEELYTNGRECTSFVIEPFVKTSFSGLCANETAALRRALQDTLTEPSCPMSDDRNDNNATMRTSCTLDYGPVSE